MVSLQYSAGEFTIACLLVYNKRDFSVLLLKIDHTMTPQEKILSLAGKNGTLHTSELATEFPFSRQYVNRLIRELVKSGSLVKFGSTRSAIYMLPAYADKHKELYFPHYSKIFKNSALEEHKVLDQVEHAFPVLKNLSENVKSIFTYAFSEMLNNAIEHSQSLRIKIIISLQNKILQFTIDDSGIGVFRSIMQKKHLQSVLEAIQELMKGKTTTMPKSHSGEGIFFTSKSGNEFILDSYGYQLTINNDIPDVFVSRKTKIKRGTRVIFSIHMNSQLHLIDLFHEYTDQTKDSDYGFDKTKIQIKLYTVAGIHISRSQARRVLSGLEKFKIIVFDFDKVPVVGQAFADELFRVFHNKYPDIILEAMNMEEGVEFMVERARHEAKELQKRQNEEQL